MGQKVSQIEIPQSVAILYQHCDYQGYSIELNLGSYNLAYLISMFKDFNNNDISSIKISSGYKVIVYAGDNFTGKSKTYTSSQNCLVNSGMNDTISSVKILPYTPPPRQRITPNQRKIDEHNKQMKLKKDKYDSLTLKFEKYIAMNNLQHNFKVKNQAILTDLGNKINEQDKDLKISKERNTQKTRHAENIEKKILESNNFLNNLKNVNYALFIITILLLVIYFKAL